MKNLLIVFLFVIPLLLFLLLTPALPLQNACAAPRESHPADQKVTVNFVDVDLTVVTKFISEVTKKNFIFDERVKGKITIIAPSKLSIEDAFSLFTSVLDLKGFTVVPSGVNAYKIIPSSEAKQRGVAIVSERKPVNESYMARLIPLKNVSSDDALKFIQPIVSKDGYASAFGPGNLLLVIDSGLNMEKVLSIIESIDQPSMREGPEIVYLKHSSADAVAKIINEGTVRRSRVVPQPATGEDPKAVADQRLNAVVIFGDKGARESIKSLIALLDVPSPEAQGRINVYFLEHADASELVKVIEGIIRGGQPRQQAAAAPGAPSVTPFEAAGGITVTADKSSNALVIVASPSDYQNLLQVIRQLDRQRRQVFVEAMIVEASMDKLRELGIKWRATVQKDGEPVVIGGFGTIDSAAIQTILTGLQGATLGGLGNFLDVPFTTVRPDGSVVKSTLTIPGFAALFNLNEFKGSINVLSSPQILTSDNKEAEIVVGENVPFITKRESDPTRTASVFSTIERKDVGIILKITPQVTEGDHVKLNIYQEISALKNESEVVTITVGPSITKRATTTSVVVKDRQTVIIGGLMQERIEDNITKLPFLGDLPLLGYLFRNRSTSREKTNLLVFLTPNIVKQAENLDAITETKRKEFAVAEGRYTPGEVLVKFKEGVTRERAVEIIGERGSVILSFIQAGGIYHLKLREKLPVEEGVKEFGQYPEVKYAEPNYTIKMQ